MTIGHASEVRHYTMHTNSFNEAISSTNEETDLGVLFTVDLKFSRHINIILKENRTLALIRRTFHSLNPHLLRILYVSLVRPQLDYLSSVWNPHQSPTNRYQCFRKYPTTCYQTDSILQTYVLPQSLNISQFTFTFVLQKAHGHDPYLKILQGLDGIPKDEFFTINTNATRGNGLKLFKKRTSLITRLHSFNFRVVNDWNTLPESLVNYSNVLTFKTLLDEHW